MSHNPVRYTLFARIRQWLNIAGKRRAVVDTSLVGWITIYLFVALSLIGLSLNLNHFALERQRLINYTNAAVLGVRQAINLTFQPNGNNPIPKVQVGRSEGGAFYDPCDEVRAIFRKNTNYKPQYTIQCLWNDYTIYVIARTPYQPIFPFGSAPEEIVIERDVVLGWGVDYLMNESP